MRQQDDFPVGELKRVTMTVGFTFVDLLQLGDSLSEAVGEDEASIASHLILERKLGARKQTDSYVGLIYGSKTSGGVSVKAG